MFEIQNLLSLSDNDIINLVTEYKLPYEYPLLIDSYFINPIIIDVKYYNLIELKFTKLLLKKILDIIVGDLINEEDIIYKIAQFFQYKIIHPFCTPPLFSDRTLIFNPILLLLLHSGKCGQINEAIKIGLSLYFKETRLVQLNNHRVCEVKLKNKWILIDASYFKNNEVFISAHFIEFPFREDNHNLLNVEEIHKNHKNHKKLLDKLLDKLEYKYDNEYYYYIININEILNDKIKFKHLYDKDKYQAIKKKFLKTKSIESFLILLSKRYTRNCYHFYRSFSKNPIYKSTFIKM